MYKSNPNAFVNYTVPEEYERIVAYKNVTAMWQNSVQAYANDVAIVDNGREFTFAALDADVTAFRAVLVEKGIKQGDNVGVYMPNCAEFVKAFLAITTLGAVAVLLPPHLDNVTVFGCSMKFSLSAIVYADVMEEKLGFLAEKNPRVARINVACTSENTAPAVDVDGAAPCTVLFTGGTTGKSKGALLSNQAIMTGTRNGCYGVKHIFGQKYLLVLPLTHVFGLIRNLLTSLQTGSTLFICRNNKDMFRDIAMFKPTILVLVPALAEMALNLSKQFGRNMLGADMKTIICGAATVPPYLVKEYLKFGIALLPGYGLTESANLVSGNPESLDNAISVGFIYPDMEYKIVDGELWLKGKNMFDCYVGEPEENATAFEDGWFKTGDLVRIDEKGFLYITGRKKEVIVLSSGENISPAEIESKFYEIEAIQDCLVYEDTENDKSILALEVYPRAVVVKALGIEDVEGYLKEKVNAVNATLPSFQRISKLVIRDTDFVRSPSMKIVRNQNGNVKK